MTNINFKILKITQVEFRGCRPVSSGPISMKFPKPVEDDPGPP